MLMSHKQREEETEFRPGSDGFDLRYGSTEVGKAVRQIRFDKRRLPVSRRCQRGRRLTNPIGRSAEWKTLLSLGKIVILLQHLDLVQTLPSPLLRILLFPLVDHLPFHPLPDLLSLSYQGQTIRGYFLTDPISLYLPCPRLARHRVY